ncbi:MAG: tetratricopeptide repeat protein [Nitrospirae bacterium]|nr:tetratricopeptide repeat protein [Nitrospirota bacterium]
MEARAEFEEALNVEPFYVQAIINLGNEHMIVGDYDVANSLYMRALKLDPGDARIYYNLGLLRRKTGEYAEAIRFFSLALQVRPDHTEARANMEEMLR